MKRVAILGSTGSIGTQALDVIRALPERLKVVALAAGSNGEALQRQAAEFGVTNLALFDADAGARYRITSGVEAISELACAEDVDIVVVSVNGVIGLIPTLAGIQAGKDIALASKEVLVAAGELVMPLIRDRGVRLTPIDSEHSAVFQCLKGEDASEVDCLILTASGGPFRGKTREFLSSVTLEQTLDHPTWRMGGKITVDSATLMNKALETIEARWLFDVSMEQIEVVVHPQSVVHSMVRFKDGSVIAQMGHPDMRLPIQYALLHPDRVPGPAPTWNPIDTPGLTFEQVDHEAFPSLRLAQEAMRSGGTSPCVLNAANEEAVRRYQQGEIRFLDIFQVVERALELHTPVAAVLENILNADRWARETVRAWRPYVQGAPGGAVS